MIALEYALYKTGNHTKQGTPNECQDKGQEVKKIKLMTQGWVIQLTNNHNAIYVESC